MSASPSTENERFRDLSFFETLMHYDIKLDRRPKCCCDFIMRP